MTRVVLDPSGFLAWFADGRGRGLRARYEAGALEIHVPIGFTLDVLEAAAREYGLRDEALEQLATEIERAGFVARPASPQTAAPLVAGGLSARQAAYAAVAAELDAPLASGDPALVERVATARDVGEV